VKTDKGTVEAPPAAAVPEPENTQEVQPQARPVVPENVSSDQIYQVRRIVIDPGHGGRDIGARGYDRKFCEKIATLDIAKRVAKILGSDANLDVFMTRDRDKYITLKYRTDFANQHKADLFVSIHCNSNPRSLATGTETYVYSARPSNKLAAVAAVAENEGRIDLAAWFAELHNQRYTGNSYALAREVDDRIKGRLKQKLRRVQKAPFYVLRQVDMPAILVETAFISNKAEEVKLKDPYWREQIAKAIADGILVYRDLVGGKGDNQQARR
jgi:N-acetylmuramoyl-L-alanine amidase